MSVCTQKQLHSIANLLALLSYLVNFCHFDILNLMFSLSLHHLLCLFKEVFLPLIFKPLVFSKFQSILCFTGFGAGLPMYMFCFRPTLVPVLARVSFFHLFSLSVLWFWPPLKGCKYWLSRRATSLIFYASHISMIHGDSSTFRKTW